MPLDFHCSRCDKSSLDSGPDEVWHCNLTMPGVGVVDLCGGCWQAHVDWCRGMVRAR